MTPDELAAAWEAAPADPCDLMGWLLERPDVVEAVLRYVEFDHDDVRETVEDIAAAQVKAREGGAITATVVDDDGVAAYSHTVP